MSKPMNERAEDNRNSLRANAGSSVPVRQPERWFAWAGRHPGVVLLGAMIMAVLVLPEPRSNGDVEQDPTGEEVPLFI